MSRPAKIVCELDQEELELLLHEGKSVEFWFEDDNLTVVVANQSFVED